MKETSFIEQNKDKWNRFQQLASNASSNPEEIADLYSDITDDLSYAQTFYQKRTVRVYLNQIAQGIHNLVHKQKGDSIKNFLTVWKVSLPLEVYRARKSLLFALCVFVFWALVGAITTHVNPDFPRLIMGDGYVDMTIKNISKGDPLGVYHDPNQTTMFFRITLNNIGVSFLCFIFGVFFTIGTHIMIFNNSIMLGAFQYFFKLKGLLLISFLGIWIHGAFEISAIVIASGAGITLGNGVLFPGSYTRLQSLQLSAKSGLKIMMSLIPFLIMAGFLESFVTEHYLELPQWSKWTIIIGSFSIILFFYVIYPIMVARKYPELVHERDVPTRTFVNVFDLNKIRTFGQVFADSFSFYRVHIGKILRVNLLLTIPLILVMLILQNANPAHFEDLIKQHEYDWASQLSIIMGFGITSIQDPFISFGWTIVFSLFLASIWYHFVNQEVNYSTKAILAFSFRKLPIIWFGLILLYLCLFYVPWYLMFIILFLAPFLWLIGPSMVFGQESRLKRFGKGLSYGAKGYGTVLMTIVLMSLVLFLFAQPIAFIGSYQEPRFMREPAMRDFLDFGADFVKDISRNYTENFVFPSNIFRQLIYVLFLLIVIPFFPILMGFLYFSEREKYEAKGLQKSFEKFGKRKRHQETEFDYE